MTPEETSALTCPTGLIWKLIEPKYCSWTEPYDAFSGSTQLSSRNQLHTLEISARALSACLTQSPVAVISAGQVTLEPNQGVWLLVWTSSRKSSRNKYHGMLFSNFAFLGFSSANLFFCRNYSLTECSIHSKVTL